MPPALPLEEYLAMIDTGRAVTRRDPAVAAARRVLTRLARKYPHYSRQQLADISVQAHHLLQAQGVALRLLAFMRRVERATPPTAGPGLRYEEACATLVTLLSAQRKP
jgi:hypothetical protein